jgi:hypothetical protein
MKALLGPEYNGKLIERFEIPQIRAVRTWLRKVASLCKGYDLMSLGSLSTP